MGATSCAGRDAPASNKRRFSVTRCRAMPGEGHHLHAGMRKPRPRIEPNVTHSFLMDGTATMYVMREVTRVLDEVLSLGGRASAFTRETHLLGAIPQLDSMAVVTLITTLEERFGIVVEDSDIDSDTFATVGSLVDFISGKTAA
jgi:acyl carrier protein